MAHAVSASSDRSGHTMLLAVLLAAVLHAGAALIGWWISPMHRHDLEDDAIEVTMEEPRQPQETPAPAQETAEPPPPAPPVAPAPTPPAEQAAAPSQPPPPPPSASAPPQPLPSPSVATRGALGVPPEPPKAELSADQTRQPEAALEPKPSSPTPTAEAAVVKPERPPTAPVVEPSPEPSAPTAGAAEATPEPPTPSAQPPEPEPAPQQQAAAAPLPQPSPAPAAPERVLEPMIPPVEAPPAPVSSRDFAKVLPPPQAAARPPSPPAAQRQATQPPPPVTPSLQHSPLSSTPNQQASRAAPSTFVNPAQEAAQTRAKDAYLWQVIRKMSQYLPDLREKNEGGTVVLRFVIGRDGRLIDASIVQSSGVIALDRGLLESLRAASPYGPLPAAIPGNQVVFTQPIAAKR